MFRSFANLWSLFIAIILISFISYSRSTMVASQVKTFRAITESPSERYELVLHTTTTSTEEVGYARFELKFYDKQSNQDLSNQAIRVRIEGEPVRRWPWEPVSAIDLGKLIDQSITTDASGRLSFDQRFSYQDKSVRYKLILELPGNERLEQVLN